MTRRHGETEIGQNFELRISNFSLCAMLFALCVLCHGRLTFSSKLTIKRP
jgi:hypothetical protein